VSALGDGNGFGLEVRAVEELRGVERYTVIEGNPFVVRDNVCGDSCGSRVHGEHREGSRGLTDGWRDG
jgi:hypothetical protein